MKRALLRLVAVISFGSIVIAAEITPKEGECWSYATRKGEETSFLVIRKIESLPKLGEVIHVSLFDVRIKSAAHPKGFTDQVGHLPIAGKNVRASLQARVEKKIPEIDWAGGYREWRRAFEAGRGGIFTSPVSECVGVLEQTVNGGKKG